MRIINVLESFKGIPASLESFVIEEEQESQQVIRQAEDLFIKKIHEHLTEEERVNCDEDYLIEEANYDDHNGYEIYLLWSN